MYDKLTIIKLIIGYVYSVYKHNVLILLICKNKHSVFIK